MHYPELTGGIIATSAPDWINRVGSSSRSTYSPSTLIPELRRMVSMMPGYRSSRSGNSCDKVVGAGKRSVFLAVYWDAVAK